MTLHNPESSNQPAAAAGVFRGIVTIVALGVALGVGFNWLGLVGQPAWGLPWIAEDRLAALESLEEVAPPHEAAPSSGGYNQIDDPMAVDLAAASSDLPVIPDLDRPIQIGIDAVKSLIDADAAVVVDAREPDEYAEGHIPGALSMPFDEITAEPEHMESLETGGRPIIVYCGGGTCEVSLTLAWELMAAGQRRVVVFMGGYPEWAEAGHPIETGPPSGA
jgi:rhodanese-related sulfurtransferase